MFVSFLIERRDGLCSLNSKTELLYVEHVKKTLEILYIEYRYIGKKVCKVQDIFLRGFSVFILYNGASDFMNLIKIIEDVVLYLEDCLLLFLPSLHTLFCFSTLKDGCLLFLHRNCTGYNSSYLVLFLFFFQLSCKKNTIYREAREARAEGHLNFRS